jgi:hypothetical protein
MFNICQGGSLLTIVACCKLQVGCAVQLQSSIGFWVSFMPAKRAAVINAAAVNAELVQHLRVKPGNYLCWWCVGISAGSFFHSEV